MNPVEQLPPAFTRSQALESGLSKQALYRLRNEGQIENLSRGLYCRRNVEVPDLDLIEIAARAPAATLCLSTALARHNLCDAIPAALDVAIPRTARSHPTSFPVAWHRFDARTFHIGRSEIELGWRMTVGIYCPQRSIIDAFRMRSLETAELGREALRRWLRTRDANPASPLRMAECFPRTLRVLRETMEILL